MRPRQMVTTSLRAAACAAALLAYAGPAQADWFVMTDCAPQSKCWGSNSAAHIEAVAATAVEARIDQLCPGGECPPLSDTSAVAQVLVALDNCEDLVYEVEVTWTWRNRAVGDVLVINDRILRSYRKMNGSCAGPGARD